MPAQPVASTQYLNRPNSSPLVLDKKRPIHFIGVGGIGMSALAKVLLEQGFEVSGSDAKDNQYLVMLRELGGKISVRHSASHVPKNAVVIASSAISTENPEAAEATKLGLPIYHRSDLLREILKLYEVSIGLTGTHGKTTMTGMTGMVLELGGLDPTIIAGGKVPCLGTNAKTGKNLKYAVAELDESDGTVIQYRPTYSVIANLELDHTDHYQEGLESLKETFKNYLNALTPENTVLFNMDCPVTLELYRQYASQFKAIKVYTESVPQSPDSDTYYLRNVELHTEGAFQGDLYQENEKLGTLWMQVPGLHNLGNAMYAAIIGQRMGVPFDRIRHALENFTGMARRFEKLGTYSGALVVDDYAHHPTEVKATLKGAREYNQHRGRVIAMFQPHRFQRLESLWDEFLEAFEDADEVIIVDVYAAGEAPIEGINSQRFANAMSHPEVEYWPSSDWDLVTARLKTILTNDDLFITLGAGDVTQVGRTLVAQQ